MSPPKPAAALAPPLSASASPTQPTALFVRPGKPELVLIGVSTGGPNALGVLLPALAKPLGVPILIVQHMPPIFTQSMNM
jgi:two-component system chemotaxis response regulator CheB